MLAGRGECSEGKEWLEVPVGGKGHHVELLSILSMEVGSGIAPADDMMGKGEEDRRSHSLEKPVLHLLDR